MPNQTATIIEDGVLHVFDISAKTPSEVLTLDVSASEDLESKLWAAIEAQEFLDRLNLESPEAKAKTKLEAATTKSARSTEKAQPKTRGKGRSKGGGKDSARQRGPARKMMSPQEMGKLEVFLFHAVAKDTGMGLRVARVKSLLDAQTDKYKALTNVDITNRLLSMSGRGMVSRDKRNGQVYWGSDPEMSAARMSEMAQSREGTGPGSGAAKPKPKAAESSTPTPLSAPTPVVSSSVPLSEDRPSEGARTEQDQQALGAQQREA